MRLGDVANVLDDIQNNKSVSWYDDERSVNLMVQRQPGTNTVEVATRVKEAMAEIEKGLPPTLKIHIQYDRSISIKNAVADVKMSLLVALALVVAVIFIFLRNTVATLIPSLTLPLAIVGTFSVMYALDFSIDNLSLMALTLAVGFIVDDAIVMLENIVRHIEMGKPPRQAALEGSQEVGFTVLSMCLSLAAVFIPLMFMGGIIGRLFREFAITISVSILVSGLVALTLTPMLCSRLLKSHDTAKESHGRLFNFAERVFNAALRGYERSLGWVMRHRPVTLVFSGVILSGDGAAVDGDSEGTVSARRHRLAERDGGGAAGYDVRGDAHGRKDGRREARHGHERGVVHDERRRAWARRTRCSTTSRSNRRARGRRPTRWCASSRT